MRLEKNEEKRINLTKIFLREYNGIEDDLSNLKGNKTDRGRRMAAYMDP